MDWKSDDRPTPPQCQEYPKSSPRKRCAAARAAENTQTTCHNWQISSPTGQKGCIQMAETILSILLVLSILRLFWLYIIKRPKGHAKSSVPHLLEIENEARQRQLLEEDN